MSACAHEAVSASVVPRAPPPPPPAKRLRAVFTADDLGYAPARDAGIFACARAGLVTAASLLVGGASARAAAQAARAAGLPLGLHVNLSEGAPLCAPRDVASLLAEAGAHAHAHAHAHARADGVQQLRGKAGLRAALAAGRVSLAEARAEVRAQLAAFAALTGGPPAHADGPQHVHVLPGLREVFAEECAAAGVRWVRVPELHAAEAGAPALAADAGRAAFVRGVAADCAAARALFAAHGLRSSSAFAGYAIGGAACSVRAVLDVCAAVAATRDDAQAASDSAGTPDLEVMFHPGFVVPRGALSGLGAADSGDDFSRSQDREVELAVLTSSELLRELATQGVTLSGWG